MATKVWISTSSTDFTASGNWLPTGAPANNDVLVFNGLGTANCTTNLSTALTGITVNVEPSYGGQIGSVSAGAATYLVLDGGTLNLPRTPNPAGASGSQRIFVNFGSTAATVNGYFSNSTGAESFYPPVLLLGSALTINASGASIGVAVRPGETAAVVALNSESNGGSASSILFGTGVTVTAATINAGTLTSRSSQTDTAIRVSGSGTYVYEGTCAHTTMNVDGGKVVYNGSGTIAALNVRGSFDASGNAIGFTVTTPIFYAGAQVNIDNGIPTGTSSSAAIILTNAVQFPDGMAAVQLKTPKQVKATIVNI